MWRLATWSLFLVSVPAGPFSLAWAQDGDCRQLVASEQSEYQVFVLLAEDALNEERWLEGADYLQRAQKLCKNAPRTSLLFAQVAMELRRCDEAEVWLSKAQKGADVDATALADLNGQMEQRCRSAVVRFECYDNVEVMLDGQGPLPCHQAIPTAAGLHTVTASRNGNLYYMAEVLLRGGANLVVIPNVAGSGGGGAWAPWVLVVSGGLIAAGGAGLQVWAWMDGDAINSDKTLTWQKARDRHDSAKTLSTVGLVGLGTGLAMTTAGVLWLVLRQDVSAEQAGGWLIGPSVDGVFVQGRF